MGEPRGGFRWPPPIISRGLILGSFLNEFARHGNKYKKAFDKNPKVRQPEKRPGGEGGGGRGEEKIQPRI